MYRFYVKAPLIFTSFLSILLQRVLSVKKSIAYTLTQGIDIYVMCVFCNSHLQIVYVHQN